ncbi:MAG: hypothetical protein EOP50_08440 [Sphingobacteriales bacterium]|nr:MAG: hypothetical protein EOP50_08440 [Sphingobacteriales bacterium]
MEPNRKPVDGQQVPNSNESPGLGPQGIDKAPGEEPSQDNVQFTQETQKGKQSVDADLDREEDRSVGEQDI